MDADDEVKRYWSSREVAIMAEDVAVERGLSLQGMNFSSVTSYPGTSRRAIKEGIAMMLAVPAIQPYRSES